MCSVRDYIELSVIYQLFAQEIDNRVAELDLLFVSEDHYRIFFLVEFLVQSYYSYAFNIFSIRFLSQVAFILAFTSGV
jgi:hypothetical protein